jgi:hypothetical protein
MTMLTQEMIDNLMAVNMNTVDVEKLANISTTELDNSLSKEKRMNYNIEKLINPFCYRFGEMGIKLEFDDNAPPLKDFLASYLIRKKSGL